MENVSTFFYYAFAYFSKRLHVLNKLSKKLKKVRSSM